MRISDWSSYVVSSCLPLGACPAARGPVGTGPRRARKERRRLIKILLVIGLLVLLLGGGAKRVVAGGARSLDMADRWLGGGGARLLLQDQPYGHGPRQSPAIWVPEAAGPGDRLPGVGFFHGGGWARGARTRVCVGG